MIKKLLLLLFLFVPPAWAADWPASELYLGPSYLRVAEQDLAGVQVGITVNRWKHLSLVGTFGYHGGNQQSLQLDSGAHHPPGRCDDEPSHFSDHDNDNDNSCPIPKPEPEFVTSGVGDVYTYLGGVRIRKKLIGRLAGFSQAQAGGARVGDDNGLALAVGGGAQVSINQRFAVEGRVEYLRIRIAGNYLNGSPQATVGLVVRFGPWWGGFRKP